jgi:molybdenum cofactor cytidylyltransferase
LGTPKQLLPFGKANLLLHAIAEAKGTSAGNIIVVLGANGADIAEKIQPQQQFSDNNSRVSIVINEEWSEGIAASIRKGVEQSRLLLPEAEGVIIMVCDQPLVDSHLLNRLVETHYDTKKGIVTSQYKDAVGTPVYFNSNYFDELLKLTGDTGAKKVIMSYGQDVSLVHFSGGEIDIDTKEDIPYLSRRSQEN